MKRIIIVFLSLLILILASCAEEKIIYAPPLDLSGARIEYNHDLSFAEILPETECVAKVRIKNWLGDIDIYERRCFEAEVLSSDSGELGENIVIATSYYGAELDWGDEIAVLLRSTDDWIEEMRNQSGTSDPRGIFPDFEYENAYEIVGGEFGVWRFAEDAGESHIYPSSTESPLHLELLQFVGEEDYNFSDIIDYVNTLK